MSNTTPSLIIRIPPPVNYPQDKVLLTIVTLILNPPIYIRLTFYADGNVG